MQTFQENKSHGLSKETMVFSNILVLKSMLRLFNKSVQLLSSCFIKLKKPKMYHAYRPTQQNYTFLS